jgi:hypothetical protein
MWRVTRILLLVLIVGVQLGSITLLLTATCETCQTRCAPGEPGCADCLLCAACCTGVSGNLVPPVCLPALVPVAGAVPPEGVLSLSPSLIEILHIPESTLA